MLNESPPAGLALKHLRSDAYVELKILPYAAAAFLLWSEESMVFISQQLSH